MKVHFFNTFLSGGAAIGTLSAFEPLSQNDEVDATFYCMENKKFPENSKFRVFNPYKKNESISSKIVSSLKARIYFHQLKKHLKNRPTQFEQFSPSKQFFDTPYSLFAQDFPDIIHLNWIAEWIDYPSFFASIPDSVPIVWTLHDMNPFTGGCHYSWDCLKYKSACSNCVQLNPKNNQTFARKNQKLKIDSLRNKNLHLVADSNWLEAEAKSSSFAQNVKSFQTIYYGLDLNVFCKTNPEFLRNKYNIPKDAFIILTGADSISNKRKGIEYLIHSIDHLLEISEKFHIVSFGSGEIEKYIGHPRVTFLGAIKRGREMAEIYSSADVFVIPSLYEAFGLTSIESMACEVPVIGFDTGGIPESIIPYKTGLLVKTGDSSDLTEKIIWMMEHPNEKQEMGKNSRRFVEERFTLENQAEKYTSLYKSLL